jgi:Icc-related predicted phosphoesterase
LQSIQDSSEKEMKMKNQIKKKNQVTIPDVIMETTPILIMSEIKRTTMILTIIGNDDNSGTRELNNQDERRMKKKLHVMCFLGFGIEQNL